jgi:hypothetical protein
VSKKKRPKRRRRKEVPVDEKEALTLPHVLLSHGGKLLLPGLDASKSENEQRKKDDGWFGLTEDKSTSSQHKNTNENDQAHCRARTVSRMSRIVVTESISTCFR